MVALCVLCAVCWLFSGCHCAWPVLAACVAFYIMLFVLALISAWFRALVVTCVDVRLTVLQLLLDVAAGV